MVSKKENIISYTKRDSDGSLLVLELILLVYIYKV